MRYGLFDLVVFDGSIAGDGVAATSSLFLSRQDGLIYILSGCSMRSRMAQSGDVKTPGRVTTGANHVGSLDDTVYRRSCAGLPARGLTPEPGAASATAHDPRRCTLGYHHAVHQPSTKH